MKYLLFGLVFTGLAAGQALAQDCAPLKTVATVALQPSPSHLVEFVPVKLNGVDKKLVLDTGGYTSQITPQTVDALKLPVGGTLGGMKYIGGQNQSVQSTTVSQFEMGNMRARDIGLLVASIPGLNREADGLLASDFFLAYDIDMDFGHDTLNFISSDHCPGKVVYWQAQALAEVPLRIINGHYLIPVMLNGRSMQAMIDTGAPRTSIGLATAQQHFGLTANSPGMEAAAKANGLSQTYMHKFDALSFNGVEIHDPTLAVIDSPMLERERAATGAHVIGAIQPWDMILGMDMMRHLHVYIATRERKIYITPA